MKRLAKERKNTPSARWLAPAIIAASLWSMPANALDKIDFTIESQNESLDKIIRAASLLLSQQADKQTQADEMFTAARSDYARIMSALYAEGYYGPVIRIKLDGREAATIPPLDAPNSIKKISVFVDPGPQFKFSSTKIAPLTKRTVLSPNFAPGEIARSGVIEAAVAKAVSAWRDEGYAKANPERSDVIANYPTQKVSVDVELNEGPKLKFGPLTITGAKNINERRLYKIAGYPEGETFSPSELKRVETRLRRTGIFSSISVTEGDVVPVNQMPIAIAVTEQKPRHYSVGAEIASQDGVALTGTWLHRNLWGGGERFSVDGEVRNIGGKESGKDYHLGFTLERPATPTADTTAGVSLKIGYQDEVDIDYKYATFGGLLTQYRSEQLTLKGGLDYNYVTGNDPNGKFTFRNLALPVSAVWDRRDNANDAHKGFYLNGTLKPFYGFGDTGSGVKATLDARGYRSFGKQDFLTLAVRTQAGIISGANLSSLPRDELFYSGGGGSVRGQPYRSLGIKVLATDNTDFIIGGSQMVIASTELRTRITPTIGAVLFYDYGAIGGDYNGQKTSLSNNFQSGAGIGVRYETGFGPIRLDVATPVSGDTGDGVQLYIGLGQSF